MAFSVRTNMHRDQALNDSLKVVMSIQRRQRGRSSDPRHRCHVVEAFAHRIEASQIVMLIEHPASRNAGSASSSGKTNSHFIGLRSFPSPLPSHPLTRPRVFHRVEERRPVGFYDSGLPKS
jgi:hypothetical protein